MKNIFFWSFLLLLLTNCRKETVTRTNENPVDTRVTHKAVEYLIKKGQHDCTPVLFNLVDTAVLKFSVRFDSTAIYQSSSLENQYDINKLYGFSDNNSSHHEFSARFGWAWNDNALRLYAYTYNNGVRSNVELGTIAIGVEYFCSLQVAGSSYIFSLNDHVQAVPRLSTTPKAKGYMLYPYFGGDDVAPHDVHIWIKDL